jgi:uncharacterized protein (TIGR02266 family)
VGVSAKEAQKLPSAGSDAESFHAMRSRLLAVVVPLRPWFDAGSFARTALLVADYLAQPAIARKVDDLAKLGVCDVRCVGDLPHSARALLHVITQAGDRRRRSTRVSGATDVHARELRTSMIDVIERELHDSDEARLWLEVVRSARDEDDLVLDLRTLAHMYRVSEKHLEKVRGASDAERRARHLADSLEEELAGKAAATEWGDWLARAFALLVVVYDEACRVARFVSPGETQVNFASLVGIARARRRQPRTVAPSPLPPPPPVPAVAPPPPAAVIPQPPPPKAEPLPEEPATARAPSSRPSVRAHERRAVELEVDFGSDSNFYVGFAENLSGGGVFVATYVLRPIGTKLHLSIRLAGDAELLHVRGEVRWTREARSGDLWPGMGVRFDALSAEDEERIRGFLGRRDPLFFDE